MTTADTRHTTGAQRARALLFAKLKANNELYAGLAEAPPSRQLSRQFLRREAREATEQLHATDRERTSCNIIAANRTRKRLSPRPASTHPKGLKHAWQRKAAFMAAMAAIAKAAA